MVVLVTVAAAVVASASAAFAAEQAGSLGQLFVGGRTAFQHLAREVQVASGKGVVQVDDYRVGSYLGHLAANAGVNEYLVEITTMLCNLITEFLVCRFWVYRNSINTNKLAKRGEKENEE